MAHKRRSDQEWLSIIQECKSSGYPDTEWCRQNNIPLSTFYSSLNRLRQKALIDKLDKPIIRDEQEVIEVHLQHEQPKPVDQGGNTEVGLRLNINGITIDILNSAAKTTIENTLQSLRSLC